MTFQFGQDLEMDQLRTNHNISKILTTPFGKKEGCDGDKSNNKGGSVGNPFNSFREAQFSPQSFCRTSLKSKLNGGQNGY